MARFARTAAVRWRPLTQEGEDVCELLAGEEGFAMGGRSLRTGPVAMAASYTVRCDPGWATVSVDIHRAAPGPERRLELRADGRGRWWRDGEEVPALEGCLDVDLGCTPATNTLPIRRLALAVGGRAEIVAAWVRFPDLEVQPLRQRYRRLTGDRYEYASDSFQAELTVDEHGLVVDYAGGWARERDPN